MRRRLALASSLIVLFAAGSIRVIGARDRDQQTPPAAAPTPTPSPTPKVDEEDGTPITSAAVKTACGDCHSEDAKHRFTRISYRRTTPEGWQETIRRMVSLNKASIEPDQAREVVKYLSDHLGLAPEEVKPAAFEVERRLIDFKYAGDAETERVCSSCHSIGRVMLQRRSAQEWNLLVNMHRGWYPLVDFQVFRRQGPADTEPGADGRPPDSRHPYEKAVAHLKSAFPLTTQEWTAWSATMRSPQLAGTWALKGYENGSGPFYGQMTITAGASPDEFTTSTSFTYPRSGKTVTRAGRAVIYTGFQWRGRSTVGGNDATSLREVMMIDRVWRTLSGRWFTGGYDEIGVDVQLTRVSREPVVLGLDRPSIKVSSSAQGVRLYGANLPANLSASDIDFGRGVSVTRVVSSTPTLVTMDVTVAADAPPGAHDLVVSGVVARAAVAIYSQVDFIKISPGWNMARVGGVVFPKMLAQFEAIAYSNGPDGKPDTNDDIALGPVDATWTTEEYMTTYDDDDVKFVGEIDGRSGAFTPALDGPNPARSGNRNNVGDVWVVAIVPAPPGASTQTPMRARAHLVVTVPLFMRWDFFTVGGR
jgi:quinohemoprotein amine dehydrogenase